MKIHFNFVNSAKKEINEHCLKQSIFNKNKNSSHITAGLESIKEFKKLVGLGNIKELVEEIIAFVKIQKKRELEGLATEPMVFHMIFKGNPGTGKTTVARLMGKLFKELGILEKGDVNEVERADLVGEYVGHTAQKTREQVRKSLGGVLFIDEAYSLARGGVKDFGKEAIDVLVKAMEDYRNDFVLILAGYKVEMELFLNSNPGLRSRFPIQLEFSDYTVEELLKIAKMMLEERQYCLTAEAEIKLKNAIRNAVSIGHCYEGNARLARNIIEKSIRAQALRLIHENNFSREQLIYLKACDIEDLTSKINNNNDNNVIKIFEAKKSAASGGN
ncbi:MAG: Stage V sporulation protein K [Clostridia bacterium 41_269]|nr:MAG: Stage V sporulation protein K [Clostridia bacterium 41_269]